MPNGWFFGEYKIVPEFAEFLGIDTDGNYRLSKIIDMFDGRMRELNLVDNLGPEIYTPTDDLLKIFKLSEIAMTSTFPSDPNGLNTCTIVRLIKTHCIIKIPQLTENDSKGKYASNIPFTLSL